jgi:hypothetical protein
VTYVPNVVKEKKRNTIDTVDSKVLSNVAYVPSVVKKRNTIDTIEHIGF